MDRWQGKVAVVTGASSGIGAAISEALVKNGLKVVGLARREDKLKELENTLRGPKGKQFYSVKTDLRKEEEIVSAFQWIEKNLGGVHVLVNNAGMNKMQVLQAQDVEDWREVYDVNLLALQICTKEALKSMKIHNINDGQIVNISSMAAHVSSPIPGLGTYFASKKAVNAISEAFRVELQAQNSDIRVTTISPGLVNTEILGAAGLNFPPEVLAIALKVSDVADTVIYALQLAPHILLSELVIQTVKYIGDAVVKANSVRQQ